MKKTFFMDFIPARRIKSTPKAVPEIEYDEEVESFSDYEPEDQAPVMDLSLLSDNAKSHDYTNELEPVIEKDEVQFSRTNIINGTRMRSASMQGFVTAPVNSPVPNLPKPKTKEELLAIARKQAIAMQNTDEARLALAKREEARRIEQEAKLLAQKQAEIEKRKAELQKLKHSSYPPRPRFINTSVKKRPLSRSVTYQEPKVLKYPAQYQSKQSIQSQEAPSSTQNYDLYSDYDNENYVDHLSGSSRSATVIVPSTSRKTPNLAILATIAIIAGAIIGSVIYLLFLDPK